MSHESGCSFCESLRPAAPGWGSKPGKCPLCKQDLWTAQDGATYRVGTAPASVGAGQWIGALGAAICISVALGGAWFAMSGRTNPTVQTRFETQPDPRPMWSHYKPVDPPATAVAQPSTNAKPGVTVAAARVKPLPVQEVKSPALVAQAPVEAPTPMSKGPGLPTTYVPASYTTAEALYDELRSVAEVDLDLEYLKLSKAQIAAKAREIAEATKKDKDAFVRKLMKDGGELAGLPFLLGKDCTITGDQSKSLALHSMVIRAALVKAEREASRTSQTGYPGIHQAANADQFWTHLSAFAPGKKATSVGIPALQQILTVESKDLRLSLLAKVQHVDNPQVTELAINRAVFDLEPSVRAAAIEVLRYRPKKEYRAALEKALRYPWRPPVRHAADAVVALQMSEMVPHLLTLLDESDPGAPFAVKQERGKEKTMVRELVRINHHRNCMLCHAPMEIGDGIGPAPRDLPIGPAPFGQDPLPPRSSSYSPRNGGTLVRADVTYLRQDFSLLQEVANPGKWSPVQRFDFVVRTRELGVHSSRYAPPIEEYRAVISGALVGLTNQYAEPTAQAWREVLASIPITAKAKAAPSVQRAH